MTRKQFHAIPTPRTDAAWASHPYPGSAVSVHVARQLERELFLAEEALRQIKIQFVRRGKLVATDTLRTLAEVRNTK